MRSVEDRIRARIRRAPPGWIMTNRDFAKGYGGMDGEGCSKSSGGDGQHPRYDSLAHVHRIVPRRNDLGAACIPVGNPRQSERYGARENGTRAGVPPWFPTNLGVPAEDNRKMAGLAPAVLVFGKRAESPINLGVFEVVPSRGHRTEHRSDRCRFVVRENPERARKRPRSIENLSPAFSCVCGVASSCRAGVVRRARALAPAPTTRRCGAT